MIHVLQPGPLLTVQDCGRAGARRWGVPASGALDWFAQAAANRLVGNPPGAAVLEITAGGCALRFEAFCVVAVAGGGLGAATDAGPLPLWRACLVRPGAELRFRRRGDTAGGRAYLAVAGGIDIAPQLGSRSALVGGPFGGLLGRPLRPGDRLSIGATNTPAAGSVGDGWPETARPDYAAPGSPATIRYLRGPHRFSSADRRRFHAAEWAVSATSNRMGFRLEDAELRPPTATLPSLGVVPGVIQVPPDGRPIVLLADAQTTGGYPIIGAVISADLPLLCQLLPGDRLRFRPVSLAAAAMDRRRLDGFLATPLDQDEPWGAPI